MGYYSDAGLALTQRACKTLSAKLADPKLEPRTVNEVKLLLEHADQHYRDAESGAEVWKWDSIKWYSGEPRWYPEIHFLENLMETLDEQDYRFIRVGEDYDDTEVRGYFSENPFDLELKRGIAICEAHQQMQEG